QQALVDVDGVAHVETARQNRPQQQKREGELDDGAAAAAPAHSSNWTTYKPAPPAPRFRLPNTAGPTYSAQHGVVFLSPQGVACKKNSANPAILGDAEPSFTATVRSRRPLPW